MCILVRARAREREGETQTLADTTPFETYHGGSVCRITGAEASDGQRQILPISRRNRDCTCSFIATPIGGRDSHDRRRRRRCCWHAPVRRRGGADRQTTCNDGGMDRHT